MTVTKSQQTNKKGQRKVVNQRRTNKIIKTKTNMNRISKNKPVTHQVNKATPNKTKLTLTKISTSTET